MRGAMIVVACVGLMQASQVCADQDPQGQVEAEALIRQLGDKSHAARQAAQEKLKAMGAAALPAVRRACFSDDPEIRTRAREIYGGFEILRLPKAQAPSWQMGGGFLRVSPTLDRCLYIRQLDQGGLAALHVRELAPEGKDDPVPLALPMSAACWQRSFRGRCWRSDGLQAAYLLAEGKDDRDGEPVHDRLGVAVMQWDLRPVQQAGGGSAAPYVATGVSFQAKGKDKWASVFDLQQARSRVARPDGQPYQVDGMRVENLTTGPLDRYAAWTETTAMPAAPPPASNPVAREAPPAGARPARETTLVVFDGRASKVIHRLKLTAPMDVPMVWDDKGDTLYYGDVVQEGRVRHRVVFGLDLAGGKATPVTRDAIAVASTPRGLVVNAGPSCTPTQQMLSSYAPVNDDRPVVDRVMLIAPDGGEPQVLAENAIAQQVVGGDLILAEMQDVDIVIYRVPLAPGLK